MSLEQAVAYALEPAISTDPAAAAAEGKPTN
jgi:hypothetical protein